MLGKILKAIITTAEIPIEVTKDVLTLGLRSVKEGKSYTREKIEELVEDLDEIL